MPTSNIQFRLNFKLLFRQKIMNFNEFTDEFGAGDFLFRMYSQLDPWNLDKSLHSRSSLNMQTEFVQNGFKAKIVVEF